MSIWIKKITESLFTAELRLPDMPQVAECWKTPEPMRVDRIIDELLRRGAHQIDIADAFQAADPDWITAFSIGSSAKACVCRQVLERSHSVLLVWRTDGSWHFGCGADHGDESEHVVTVGHVIESDKTLVEFHDLPIGWKAERQGAGFSWNRAPLG